MPSFAKVWRSRQWGLLDQPDDLQFLDGAVSHTLSSPAPIALFFSRRFSSVSSATTSFSALASWRSALTSSEVAARAVSPARRFLPASRNSLTSDNRGSGRSPRGGTARRYCPRRADPKERCESSPLRKTAAGWNGGPP